MLEYSVVIPVYNEEESIKLLYFSLQKVMDSLVKPYEIIFVNDGSEDKSLEVLRSIELSPFNLSIVNLKKHYGQSIAMQAGFSIANGAIIITLDADLQNDPEDIPRLLDELNKGLDVVCGWRHNRKDNRLRRFSSKIAALLRKIISREKIHDVGCTLRVFRRAVLRDVYLSRGMHRFFSFITVKLGYKVGEIKVQHHPRRFGKSKYNMRNRLIQGFLDLTRFSIFDIKTLMEEKADYEIKEVIRKFGSIIA